MAPLAGRAQSIDTMDVLADLREMLGEVRPNVPRDSLIMQPPKPPMNRVSVDHYWQSGGNGDTLLSQGLNNYLRLNVQRTQSLLGTEVAVGGSLFVGGNAIDKQRSGLNIGFDRHKHLDRLRAINPEEVDRIKAEAMDRYAAASDRFSAAREILQFEELLDLMTSEGYRRLHEKVAAVQDSTIQHTQSATDSLTLGQGMEAKRRIAAAHTLYDSLGAKVQGYSTELRREARQIVDSVAHQYAKYRDDDLIKDRLNTSSAGLVDKLLLLSKSIRLGNTRMGTDRELSIGLPIRGFAYTYAYRNTQVEVEHGKRILSMRLTPREGVVYHDRQRGMRLTRVAVTRGSEETSQYTGQVIIAKEAPGASTANRRTNHVYALSSNTKIRSGLSLILSGAYARSVLVTSGDLPAQSMSEDLNRNTTGSVGLNWRAKNVDVAIEAFRRGSLFRSAANPYLLIDLEGFASTTRLNLWKGRLTANLRTQLGRGTNALTKNNTRIAIQGQLRLRTGRRSSVGALFAPNQYRYSVTGREGFSDVSIYRLDYQYTGERSQFSGLVTNLNQGLSWNDTTTVNKTVNLQLNAAHRFGEVVSVQLASLHVVQPKRPLYPVSWWNTLSILLQSKVRSRLSGTLERLPNIDGVVPGAAIDVELPLGNFGVARFNVFYRAIGTVPPDTPHATLSGFSHLSTQF